MQVISKDPTDILARTIFGEARGEYKDFEGGIASLIAVGNVIMNRVRLQSHYGGSIEEVCLKPWQFSCWNLDDPNRLLLMRPEITDPVFTLCSLVATKVSSGEWPDLTKGCDHYHAITLPAAPTWAQKHKPKAKIGKHLFYELEKRKET